MLVSVRGFVHRRQLFAMVGEFGAVEGRCMP